jgi:hypothetical protein
MRFIISELILNGNRPENLFRQGIRRRRRRKKEKEEEEEEEEEEKEEEKIHKYQLILE